MHRLRPVLELFTQPSLPHFVLLIGLAAGVAALWFLLARLSTPAVLSIAIASEVFSGYWKYIHSPLPLDRVLMVVALWLVFWRGTTELSDRKLLFSPIHLLMAALVLYVVISAWSVGTLSTSVGKYAILDRLGVVPFVMFTLAPLVFRTRRSRDVLLAALVSLGAYLAFTAIAEGAGAHFAVFPRYILDPTLGIHYGRARGPFLESVADGLSMFMCGTAAAVALAYWRRPWARRVCYLVMAGSIAGGILTLTRSVWLGDAAGPAVAMLWSPKLRRYLLPAGAAVAVAVAALLFAVPSLSSRVGTRAGETLPVYDRYNTNDAALRAFVQHPVFGIGWEQFENIGSDYLRQADTYPQTGAGLEVHNVFLSHLVELGILGAVMWTAALLAAVGGAIVRRGPPELYPWRLGLVAVFVAFLVAANLGPMSYPLPNLLLWLWAGIVASDRYSTARPRGRPARSTLPVRADRAPALLGSV